MPGKPVADAVFADLEPRVAALRAGGRNPGLGTILVGNESASAGYIRMKQDRAASLGFGGRHVHLDDDASQADLVAAIRDFNTDDEVDAVLIQHPIPPHLDYEAALTELDPDKDADGAHPMNMGRLALGMAGPLPCTPAGIVEMLHHEKIETAGKNCVIVGRSNIVGKPMAMLMLRENSTVTVCHSKTENLASFTSNADILIAAVGRAKMITADMVKPGAAVIDVGMNRDENGKLCGDVDFESVSKIAGAITPVPGGVGPMTVALLMRNTAEAAAHQNNIG